jgi:hypothetical protein
MMDMGKLKCGGLYKMNKCSEEFRDHKNSGKQYIQE